MHAAPKSAPCQMDAESRLLALSGHVTMSDLSPQSDPKRTLLDRSHLSRFYEYTPDVLRTMVGPSKKPTTHESRKK
jgi:hypothetical protein